VGFDGRHGHGKSVASCGEHLRRFLHSGDPDQNLAQLCRIALLRAIVGR
jgi:hypothetical protein